MARFGTTVLESKNAVVVVVFIFYKRTGLCGRLADSNDSNFYRYCNVS